MNQEPFAADEAVRFIAGLFGNGATEQGVFLCSLPNGDDRDGQPGEKAVVTRDPSVVERFGSKWDRPGRALYFCVSTIRADATPGHGGSVRSKENVAEIAALHADVDFKDVAIGEEEILRRIGLLPIVPRIIVQSGRGLHLYWTLKEAIDVSDLGERLRVETALRQLSDLVGGDPAVAEVARLMRLPGSHNTKDRGWRPVKTLRIGGDPVLMEEMEDMLGMMSPIIARKERPAPREAASNPFLAAAALLGFSPPVDVPGRLGAMRYQGDGEDSIHSTQLAVTASLLNRGDSLEDVVRTVLAATKAAAGEYGERWNWHREERTIRRMCETWLAKNPRQSKQTASGETVDSENVVSLDQRRHEKEVEKAKGSTKARGNVAAHIVLGQGVIDAIRQRGEDLIVTSKAAYRYADGLWRMETDGLKAWLDVEIETGCRELGIDSAGRVVNEARQWILRNPELWRPDVAWDGHGKVPTRSGLVDVDTGALEPARPEHYCTWRIDCDYDPLASAPWFEIMMADMFGDRSDELRRDTVATIQEIAGSALIDVKPRALSKALILQGGSNCGKSGVLEVLDGMFGSEAITTPLEALEGTHGMMAFIRRAPWILHEAFDQSKWHMSSTVKAVITGEPVSINIKNGPMLTMRVRAPAFWGTNHPPTFKEATRAIVNRIVVVTCQRTFDEEHPVGAAAEALRRGYDRPSTLVLAHERPGVLNWMLTGLRRAKERGFIRSTDEMKATGEDIRRDSNLVAGFMEECVDFDPRMRIAAPDFCAAFSVWWVENKGEARGAPSNESIGRALAALGDQRIAMHPKEMRDMRRRYYGGIALNNLGVELWKRALAAKTFEGKTATTTEADGSVNTEIPAAWSERPSVAAMKRAFRRRELLHDSGHDSAKSELSSTVMPGRTVMSNDGSELSCDSSQERELSSTQPIGRLSDPLF